MKLAEHVFDAHTKLLLVEEQLGDALDLGIGVDTWEDFTYDVIDQSLEVYGVTVTLTKEQAQAILDATGFDRIWLHKHSSGRMIDGVPCRCPSVVR